jgi:hypothetical protein
MREGVRVAVVLQRLQAPQLFYSPAGDSRFLRTCDRILHRSIFTDKRIPPRLSQPDIFTDGHRVRFPPQASSFGRDWKRRRIPRQDSGAIPHREENQYGSAPIETTTQETGPTHAGQTGAAETRTGRAKD